MSRYLLLLPPPDLGGFVYIDHNKALCSLASSRHRWPKATVLTIPYRRPHNGNPKLTHAALNRQATMPQPFDGDIWPRFAGGSHRAVDAALPPAPWPRF